MYLKRRRSNFYLRKRIFKIRPVYRQRYKLLLLLNQSKKICLLNKSRTEVGFDKVVYNLYMRYWKYNDQRKWSMIALCIVFVILSFFFSFPTLVLVFFITFYFHSFLSLASNLHLAIKSWILFRLIKVYSFFFLSDSLLD